MNDPGRKPRVLLVDDEPVALRTFRRLLASDFEVESAESADKALEFFEAGSFDAVISDYRMPGHRGVWLMEKVRALSPTTLRILISGGKVPDLEKHLSTGLVQHFLAKPISPEKLAAFLKTIGLLGGDQDGK